MRRTLSLLLAAVLLLGTLSGCGSAPAQKEDGKLQIVATIWPVYDWVRNLTAGSDGVSLTLLLDSGVDMHSFQPTAADIIKLSACDVLLYVGGESDEWIGDAIEEAVNRELVAVNLMEVLTPRLQNEEYVEGMQHSEEHTGAPERDEHIWLSLENARLCCAAIAQTLEEKDPAHAALYAENEAKYAEALAALDGAYRSGIESAARDTLLFADRFPFRYLTEDYGLHYYAAFAGCEAETEASFETLAFLANKTKELALPAVLVIDGSDQKLARAVVQSAGVTGCEICCLNSMQSTRPTDASTYLSIMEENLAVLKTALN